MKILLVEDEHRLAGTLKKGFEQEHFVVDIAYDGQTGYDLAASETYDVIILDRMLPNKDGIAICTEVRSQGVHTPILMLTAKAQVIDRVTGLDAGADDYLVKPFSFEELLARIRALTRRPQQSIEPQLSLDGLTLDPTTFRIRRSGKQITLSNKEFALLEYLLRHAHMVCTKKQIIENVWDYEADILPNTVEVNIRNLRKKIDIPFPKEENLIHTIRGFGYRLGK